MQTLIDKLVVKNTDKGLVVTFEDKYFNEVSRGEHNTYKGLYVNCDIFDVVVYAPISKLYSSAEFNLDFDTPKSELLAVVIGGEIREGRIYNVDAKNLICQLCGESTVELFGKVSNSGHFEVWHNSKIYAEELSVPNATTSVQSQIFGFSYVSGSTFSSYNITNLGSLITIGIMFALTVSLALTVLFSIMFVKKKQHVDEMIVQHKNEIKILSVPQKNDENILQNGE